MYEETQCNMNMQPHADRPADDCYTQLWYNTEEQTKKRVNAVRKCFLKENKVFGLVKDMWHMF